MQKRMECIISGEVQGVSYRDFVRTSARRAGLVGSVRNLLNGTVEAVAEGEEDTLGDFLKSLKEKHPFARVDHLDVVWGESMHTFSSFTILHS